MVIKSRSATILVAEDDSDDRLLIRDAFNECQLSNILKFVEDGEELMDYLHRRNDYAKPDCAPQPALILLDLNMPKKDGRDALAEIKSNRKLQGIPVVVLTTSREKEDIDASYAIGASSYIPKPARFEELVDLIGTLGKYWFETVELPV